MKTIINLQVEKKSLLELREALSGLTIFLFNTESRPFCGVETFTFHEYFLLNFVGDIPQF